MIQLNLIDIKNAKTYIEGQRISHMVTNSSKNLAELNTGELVVVTLNDSDIMGTVSSIKQSSVILNVAGGVQEVEVNPKTTIHVIGKQTAADLSLNDHTEHTRELHDVKSKGVPETAKDKYHHFPQTTEDDCSVGDDKHSKLPASKKLSLSLGELIRTGEKVSKIVDVVARDGMHESMCISLSLDGNSTTADFVSDVQKISSKLSLDKEVN